jgi:Gram-negative porin
MHKKRMAIAMAIALGAPVAVFAQESTPSMFKFSGFGTLGVVSTDNDKAEYAVSVLQPGGAKKKADFGVDSLIAGQVDATFTPSFSAVIQAVANRTADDDYTPHVEWAFVRYAVTGDLSVRGGIMAVPVFMLSDSRLVGFSYPWVRPPTALYSQSPVTKFQGGDITYRHTLGGVNLSGQAYVGRAPTQIPSATGGGHVTADLDDMYGVSFGAETGPWTVRASYLHTKFTYRDSTVQPLFAGLRQVEPFVPGAAALADSLDTIDKTITFGSVGVGYESGNLLLQAEYSKRKADLFLADTSSWYATAGYRFGNFMPHVTYSQVRVDSPTSQSLIPAVGPLAPVAIGVNTLLEGQNVAQKALALGLRYQFHKNADVKVQWDRIDLPRGSVGNFQHAQPGFAGSNVNVYSAAVDFVF